MNLALQQQELLAVIWQPAGDEATRGLQAYRGNAQELAQRSLAAAFPVLRQLLDEDNFQGLARRFWRQCPPQRGDLAQWGGELPAFIETLHELATEEPYLADVARVEWALHKLATAADPAPDPASLGLLAVHDPARLTLRLAPAHCVTSVFPVASVLTAHLDGAPSLDVAGQRLREGVAETALAWRHGFRPRVREAAAGEAQFIARLQERASLLDSLAAVPQLDFNQWLPFAVSSGLLLAAALT